MNDLADYHYPISDLFKRIIRKEDWEEHKLNKEQLAFFDEYGYVSGVKLLNGTQIERLKNDLEEILDPKHPLHHLFYEYHSNESSNAQELLFHSLGQWRITEGFHDVLWNPAFVMAAHQLLGNRPVRFWHDQVFYKPARHGGVVAWHQDYSYWTRTIAMQHLTCWTGLDDSNEENGCLYYIPKSHKWGLLKAPEIAGQMNGLKQFLSEAQLEAFEPVAIPLKAGYATFHHPLLVHGSFENKSNRPRRAIVLNVFADGTTSNTDDALLQGVPVIPKGTKIQGKFFPLLF